MGIPAVGADLIVTPQEQFVLRAMSAEPLQTALLNANWLYLYHWPQLVSVCPTEPAALGRGTKIVVPIQPSADGQRYDFRVTAMPSANCNLTVDVEWTDNYTGLPLSATPTAWNLIYSQTTAETAATLAKQDKASQTIPATAVALRFTVAVNVGTFEIHHLLAYPHPTALAAGVAASGFVPYDDGLLTTADAPIHTEFLDRCLLNAKWILRDRRQMVLALAQNEAQANVDTPCNATSFAAWPAVRAWFPWQGDTVLLSVASLVSITGGAGGARVQVAQVADPAGGPVGPMKSAYLAGSVDGLLDRQDLQLQLQGAGLMRYADLVVSVVADAGQTTYMHSLVADWRPGDI